jgi:uncharacterized membrane protein
MPEIAAFCPGCGRPMPTLSAARGRVGILPERIAGGLAYLTFIPAIIFLTLDPYRRNVFVRLHSVQCLLLCAATLLTAAVLRLLAYVLFLIPVVGILLVLVISVVAGLAAFFLWLVLITKAFQGHFFKLPVLGEIAERYAPWSAR